MQSLKYFPSAVKPSKPIWQHKRKKGKKKEKQRKKQTY